MELDFLRMSTSTYLMAASALDFFFVFFQHYELAFLFPVRIILGRRLCLRIV